MRKVLIIVLICILVLILIVSGLILMDYFDVLHISIIDDVLGKEGTTNATERATTEMASETTTGAFTPSAIEADDYYSNNGKIVSKTEVKNSTKILTEAQVTDALSERGFTDCPITSMYFMDGKYYDPQQIDATSVQKHPLYEMYFQAENGDIWNITVVNNVFIANPVSYNLETATSSQILISETDTITGYDSVTNRFYETVPNTAEITVKKVAKIDLKTLNELTREAINAL